MYQQFALWYEQKEAKLLTNCHIETKSFEWWDGHHHCPNIGPVTIPKYCLDVTGSQYSCKRNTFLITRGTNHDQVDRFIQSLQFLGGTSKLPGIRCTSAVFLRWAAGSQFAVHRANYVGWCHKPNELAKKQRNLSILRKKCKIQMKKNTVIMPDMPFNEFKHWGWHETKHIIQEVWSSWSFSGPWPQFWVCRQTDKALPRLL